MPSKVVLVPDEVEFLFRPARNSLGSEIKLTASVGLSTKRVLNWSRPHSIQCSILNGKFLTVHTGIEFSTGSLVSEYDFSG